MSRKIVHESEEIFGWDLAIAEGEAQLKQWKAKVCRLRAAIEVCKQAKKDGLPWAADSSASTVLGLAHIGNTH